MERGLHFHTIAFAPQLHKNVALPLITALQDAGAISAAHDGCEAFWSAPVLWRF
jgi:hypothetical protein